MKKSSGRLGNYAFILPAVLYMLAMIGYPLIYNIILSFQNVDLGILASGEASFVGLENYLQLFEREDFPISISNTIIFTVVSVFFQIVIGFFLAYFFSLKFRFAAFARGIMMIAWLIPMTVTALLYKFMMSESGGIINEILMFLNIINEPIHWLSDPNLALWSVIIANIWVGIPFNMLLLSTGLSSLPRDVFEAASLDGANWYQRLIHITLPLLKPVILVVLMQGLIFTFKVFDLVFIMTGGGPINSTEVLSTVAYGISFDEFNFSLGAAAANVLFLIMFVVSLFYLRLLKKEEV